MSNKYLLPLIIAISVLTIGAVALVQSRKSDSNTVAIVSSSSVTGQSSVSSPSLQTNSVSSSTSSEYNPSKIQEQTKVQSSSAQSYAPEPIRQLQVEVLDSNNPPKYITDYLSCQKTSPTKEYGLLVETADGMLEYKCPKSLEYYGCEDLGENSKYLRYNLIWREDIKTEKNLKDEFILWANEKNLSPELVKDLLNSMHFKEGWACNTLFAGGREEFACGGVYGFPIEDLKLDYIFKFETAIITSSLGSCIVVLNQNIPKDDLQLLKNYKPANAGKLKIITLKN